MANMMTEQRLAQYIQLKMEIDSIDKRLTELNEEFVTDTVRGSTPEYINAHSIIISGYGDSRRIRRLEKRRDNTEAQLKEIEDYIDSIDDCENRVLLELRYIEDMSWPKIAREMGYSLRTIYRKYDEILKSCHLLAL